MSERNNLKKNECIFVHSLRGYKLIMVRKVQQSSSMGTGVDLLRLGKLGGRDLEAELQKQYQAMTSCPTYSHPLP